MKTIYGANAVIQINNTPITGSAVAFEFSPSVENGADVYTDMPSFSGEMSGSAWFDESQLRAFAPQTKARFQFGDVIFEQTITASGMRPYVPGKHAPMAHKKISRYLRRKGYANYEYWMTLR